MSDDLYSDVVDVRISARIELLSAEDGGRENPLLGGSSWRPNHNFTAEPNGPMCIGFIELPDNAKIHPGESFETLIKMCVWRALVPQLRPGLTWRIQQGAQLVGFGEIIELFK